MIKEKERALSPLPMVMSVKVQSSNITFNVLIFYFQHCGRMIIVRMISL